MKKTEKDNKILIVDDERIVAADLQDMLEDVGYTVAGICATGKQAIRAAGDKKPDLILMDIKLEGEMDGIQAAQQIKLKYDIPVIFITAHSDPDSIQRAKHTAPYGYMIKPFDERDLFTTLEIALYKRQMERELQDSRDKLRQLSLRISQVREEERTRIAREIHDGLGSALTMLKMDLYRFGKKLPGEDVLNAKIKSMLGIVEEGLGTVKKIATELRPSLLENLGLCEALEWQAHEFESHSHISCDTEIDCDETALSRDLSLAVFRIFQETLTNILRHARASKASIRLRMEGADLRLEVRDNGVGINPKKIEDIKSTGITGMMERILPWGGKLVVTGTKGKGTCVTLSVRLPEKTV